MPVKLSNCAVVVPPKAHATGDVQHTAAVAGNQVAAHTIAEAGREDCACLVRWNGDAAVVEIRRELDGEVERRRWSARERAGVERAPCQGDGATADDDIASVTGVGAGDGERAGGLLHQRAAAGEHGTPCLSIRLAKISVALLTMLPGRLPLREMPSPSCNEPAEIVVLPENVFTPVFATVNLPEPDFVSDIEPEINPTPVR